MPNGRESCSDSTLTDLIQGSGDCQYVDVECLEKCDQPVQKHQLATHVANNCSKQKFTCMHCELWDCQWETLASTEVPSTMPQQMSDWGCWIQCSKRPLELVPFASSWMQLSTSYAGHSEKLQRQDMEKYTEENAIKHLAQMASASKKEEFLLPYSLLTLI